MDPNNVCVQCQNRNVFPMWNFFFVSIVMKYSTNWTLHWYYWLNRNECNKNNWHLHKCIRSDRNTWSRLLKKIYIIICRRHYIDFGSYDMFRIFRAHYVAALVPLIFKSTGSIYWFWDQKSVRLILPKMVSDFNLHFQNYASIFHLFEFAIRNCATSGKLFK